MSADRVSLTDGSGKWFRVSSSTAFKEGSDWDGRNHISKATGSQWNHETLYRTAGGVWVLNCWSQMQGRTETYEEINSRDAAAWLVRNGRDVPDTLGPDVAALEI